LGSAVLNSNPTKTSNLSIIAQAVSTLTGTPTVKFAIPLDVIIAGSASVTALPTKIVNLQATLNSLSTLSGVLELPGDLQVRLYGQALLTSTFNKIFNQNVNLQGQSNLNSVLMLLGHNNNGNNNSGWVFNSVEKISTNLFFGCNF
jgi:hypothetical protein